MTKEGIVHIKTCKATKLMLFKIKPRTGQYMDTVSYRDMRQDIVTDLGYRSCCSFILLLPSYPHY